jgi:hypothetical protein
VHGVSLISEDVLDEYVDEYRVLVLRCKEPVPLHVTHGSSVFTDLVAYSAALGSRRQAPHVR